jgi:methylated-DNA-protein-cysteine methyltransferase-like protein
VAVSPFTQRVIDLIAAIPKGNVATYGGIAAMAGSPRGARQVVRVLHTCSRKEGLPWHRVVNREGKISLSEIQGYERQKTLLEKEDVLFDNHDKIDLKTYLWRP